MRALPQDRACERMSACKSERCALARAKIIERQKLSNHDDMLPRCRCLLLITLLPMMSILLLFYCCHVTISDER